MGLLGLLGVSLVAGFGGALVGSQPVLAATPVFNEVAGSPFSAGSGPAWLAFSANGKLVAVPNFDDNTVSMFSVAQGGALSQVAGSPFATGAQPSALAFSPVVSGNEFLGVTNYGDNTLSMFKVDQSTGAATEVAGSPFATGAGPYSVAFSPVVSGNEFVAVSDSNDNTMSIYQVDQSTGAATPVVGSPFATGDQPYSVAFSPVVSGNLFLAVTNYGANTASVYQVNQTTGAATEVAGSPFATGDGPYFGAFSPVVGGNVLFATADQEASQVSMFELDQSTGAVTPVAGSPFDAGAGPDQLAFNAGGNLLAVANFNDSTASVFAVSPTGAVSQVTGSPYPTGDAPDGVAFSPDGSDENLLATANFSGGTVTVYSGGPPSATILSPADHQTYALGQAVPTTFACAESAAGPGLASCDDSNATTSVSGGTGSLDTSTLGAHIYSVTATSTDGLTASTAVSYTVGPPTPPTPPAPPVPTRASGYWLAGADGGVFAYGAAGFFGSGAGTEVQQTAGIAATPDGGGYWLAGDDGSVSTFGDASSYGQADDLGLIAPITGIAPTPDGRGYWLVAADGGVFAFGDAGFFGSVGGTRGAEMPITGIARTPDGGGYWLVGSDGGVFAFGDAGFFGSVPGLGIHPAGPVAGIAPTPDGGGYWLVGADGGVFAYGDAAFFGSAAGLPPAAPVVGLAPTPDGGGYWLVGADGGVFAYGDAAFFGSAAGLPPAAPVVGIAAR